MSATRTRSHKRQRRVSTHESNSSSDSQAVSPGETNESVSSRNPSIVDSDHLPQTLPQIAVPNTPQSLPQNGHPGYYPPPGSWHPQPPKPFPHDRIALPPFVDNSAGPDIQQMPNFRALPPIIHASGSHLLDRMNRLNTTLQADQNPHSEPNKPPLVPLPPIFGEFSSLGSAHGPNIMGSVNLPSYREPPPSFTRHPLNFLVHEQTPEVQPPVFPGVPQKITPPQIYSETAQPFSPCAENPKNVYIPPQCDKKSETSSLATPPSPHNITKDSALHSVEDAFVKLMPMLTKVNTHNVCGFLLEVLKQCDNQVTLDDFYNLLYTCEIPGFSTTSTAQPSKIDHTTPFTPQFSGLKLCHLIVKTFYNPESAAGLLDRDSIERLRSSSLNFHELLREFLALKIILSSVTRVENWSHAHSSIPRISLYKAYYIFCNKLVQRYPHISKCASQNLILGQSQLGKLINLVYPKITTKRLGRRGSSKFHYIGVIWNTSVVGDDILSLIDLEIPQLEEYFNNIPKKRIPQREPSFIPNPKINHQANPSTAASSSYSSPGAKCPSRSFVDLSNRYPSFDCSPRIWKTTPNKIPQQSEWAKRHIEKSLKALKSYDVQLDPLISNCNAGIYPEYDDDGLSETLVKAMNVLSGVSASKDTLSHLYLVILLVIFPVAIASDEEVPEMTKIQFRNSIKNCITRLECETSYLIPTFEESVGIFLRILRKMVYLNELTSCKIPVRYSENVLKEMIRDLESAADCKSENFDGLSDLDETYIESIAMSMNAYNFKFIDESSMPGEDRDIAAISSLARTLKKAVMVSNDNMSMIPAWAKSQGLQCVPEDVPYRVLKIALENFHTITLADPLVLKFPIPLLTFIMLHKSNSMQFASFHDFGKRDPELSKETFKCWWMFSTMFQEYMSIFSEVFALSMSSA